MLRFFRKYQKIILAVGGTILLVIFLVPQAVTGMGSLSARRGRTLGTYQSLAGEAEKMTAGELEQAQFDLRALREGLKLPSATGELRALVDVVLGVPVDRPEHWFLLVEEAEALGLIGGSDDAEVLAQALGTLLAQQGQPPAPPDLVLEFMARNSGVNSIDAVRGALMRLQGVRRLVNLAAPGQVSPPRLAAIADDVLQGMDAQVAVIVPRIEEEVELDEDQEAEPESGEEPADDIEPEGESDEAEATEAEPEAPPFTDEELQKQFESYAVFAPGDGERGFGYRLPDRVRLEWISIDAQSVREALEKTDKVSSLELRNYWRRNRDRFTAPGAAPGAETGYEDVADQVREALLDELTAEALADIERFVDAELTRSTRELSRDGIHFVLPADWAEKRVKLHLLAERLQQFARDQLTLPLTLPAYERPEEWYSAADAALIPNIGRAFSTEYSREQRHSLRDLIPALKELDGSDSIPMQIGVAFGPLRQPDGSLYYARILEAEESHPPATLDEVREDVVTDLKRLREYDRLAADVGAIERVAVEEGMQALSEEYDTFAMPIRDLNLVPQESMFATYGRAPTMIPMLGRDDEVVRQVMQRGREIIRAMVAEGRTFEDLTADDLTFVLPVPEKLALVAVQFMNLRPASQEDVASYIMQLQDLIAREEIEEDHIEQLFSWDVMETRYAFVRTGGEEDEDDEGDGAEGSSTGDATASDS